MPLSLIIAMLRETVGLDVASVGITLIERVVQQRVRANHLQDISQYAELLQNCKLEQQNLVEAVVIPETFFFRYPQSFAAFRQIAAEQFLFGTPKIRTLCVPCSTGEEPYSIAMTLLDAGLPLQNFQTDAVDISRHSLEIARLGIFGSHSFRGSEPKFSNQYFQKTDAGLRLSDRVRRCVTFEQGNVLEEPFRFGSEPYNFIFCRNLLIYLDSQAQSRALRKLAKTFNGGGTIICRFGGNGPPESTRFLLREIGDGFCFSQERVGRFSPPLSKRKEPKIWSPAGVDRSEAYRKPHSKLPQKAALPTLKQAKKLVPDLAFAEQLADKGQLREAAEICGASLRHHGPSARVFHLLGLLHDCAGDQFQAGEFYRKALYLDPDHYDTLIHLALLEDKSGRTAAAKVLKNRARRVLGSAQ